MRTHIKYNIITLICLLASSFLIQMNAQVAIGKTSIDAGAIFQVENGNKGMMIPRVSLSSRLDTSTINGTEAEGLWVWNTNSGGSGNNRVSPGFYFWDSDEWIKVYNNGYSEQFFQTGYVKAANQSTTYTLPGLDQDITVPFTGTYQIIVVGYYAAGLRGSASTDGIGTASISLEIDNVKVKEVFLTSTSKLNGGGGTFHALAHNGNIIYNVDLVAGQTYNFKVRGREWNQTNTYNTFLGSGGYGFFGIHTNIYDGNTHAGADSECQRNYMTITLLREY